VNSRAAVYTLFILVLTGMGLVLVWVAIRFATPRPEYVEIGQLSDFPPSREPYFVNDPRPVFILNYNDVLLVLDPLNRVVGGAPVRWWTQEQAYVDPNRGTFFDRYGNPTHHRSNPDYPVEKQGLLRYPVSIRGDRIIIELSRPALNTP
jgi:hypothetical protein